MLILKSSRLIKLTFDRVNWRKLMSLSFIDTQYSKISMKTCGAGNWPQVSTRANSSSSIFVQCPCCRWERPVKGVGSAGTLAPQCWIRGGGKYLFAPTINCPIYLPVDSKTSVHLKSLIWIWLRTFQLGIFYDFLKRITVYVRHVNALNRFYMQFTWRTQNA